MKNIIIIGGGPAGLTAAYELLRDGSKEYRVTILEESTMLGGISQTVRYHGNRMDIGGHRFFSEDERIMKWWSALMPVQGKPAYDDKVLGREKPLSENGPDPQKEDAVMLVRDKVSRIYYNKSLFDYPVTINLSTFRNMGFVTALRAGFSYLKSVFKKLPEDTLENYYINRFGRVMYSMFFEGYTEKLWGQHPCEIPVNRDAQRVKGLSLSALLKEMLRKLFRKKNKSNAETSQTERFWYPKYGPGQLWELVGEKVQEMGGEIRFGCKVQKIRTDDGRITGVVCQTPESETEICGDIFISSMPVKELVAGMDSADETVSRIAAGLPYRDFVTIGLLVKKLELKNQTDRRTLANIIPDCWIYVQDKSVKLGRFQIFNNWSPYMVQKPEDTIWIGLQYFCDEGDFFWNMTDEECIAYAVRELRKMGIIQKGVCLDAHREKIRKAYPAYFDTYSEFGQVIEFLNGYENLFCVGRNGQHRSCNMDHSMLTAIRAAEAIKAGSTDQSGIWNINAETEYHKPE